MTVSETISLGMLRAPTPGSYKIQYSDNTHCLQDQWTDLFSVSPEFNNAPLAGSEEAQAFFSLRVAESVMNPPVTAPEAQGGKDHQKKKIDSAGVIRDAVTQCLVRANLLRPEMTTDTMVDVYRLSGSRAVVVIPDTNALSTGTLHWLMGALTSTQVWLLPVVVSLVTVQTRDAILKSCVNQRSPGNLPKALRSRQLINASLSLLERHRQRYQVLEVDPQLLRYVRPAGGGSSDPDEGDVLEDRLLLEAIHGALRATRSRTEKRVVTSDMLLARMLRAEGLPALFLQKPSLPTGDIPCLRYEPLAKAFVGASLPHLMWELAHTFSSVRLLHEDRPIVSFDAYWYSKTADDWAAERMLVLWEPEAVSPPPAPNPIEESDIDIELKSAPQGTPAPKSNKTLETAAVAFLEVAVDAVSTSLSRAVIPEVAFPQIIRMSIALERGSGTIAEIRERVPEADRPSSKVATYAGEVLIRGKFAELRDDQLFPAAKLTLLSEYLSNAELDAASSLWEEFEVYRLVVELLKKKSVVKPSKDTANLAKLLGSTTALDRSERVWRLPTFLGQAWTDGDQIRDGSARPDRDKVRQSFESVFAEFAQDGLASLADLIPGLCRALKCSPWFIQKSAQTLVNDDQLSDFSFQPSAGKRAASTDQIIKIHDGELKLVSSPADRFDIGGRPVFTVLRTANS